MGNTLFSVGREIEDYKDGTHKKKKKKKEGNSKGSGQKQAQRSNSPTESDIKSFGPRNAAFKQGH